MKDFAGGKAKMVSGLVEYETFGSIAAIPNPSSAF